MIRNLWDYANGEGGKVLKKDTVDQIGRCGVDFFAINMATSKALSIIGERWFGGSIKRLYDLVNKFDKMPRQQMEYLLKKVSVEAAEIGEAWKVIAVWYIKVRQRLESAVQSIKTDDKVKQSFSQTLVLKLFDCFGLE